MLRSFWRRLALFAWRRWARAETHKPVGVPGNRDPESPCEAYSPRARKAGDWGACETDGHYLCQKCCHRKPDEAYAEEDANEFTRRYGRAPRVDEVEEIARARRMA